MEERCLRKKVMLLENTRLMHEENFLSSWLREEGKVMEAKKKKKWTSRLKEEMGKHKG